MTHGYGLGRAVGAQQSKGTSLALEADPVGPSCGKERSTIGWMCMTDKRRTSMSRGLRTSRRHFSLLLARYPAGLLPSFGLNNSARH